MVGRQVDKVILFPSKRGSKCGKMDKKRSAGRRGFNSPRARHFSTQYLNNILFGIKFITIANYCFYILMSLAIWF